MARANTLYVDVAGRYIHAGDFVTLKNGNLWPQVVLHSTKRKRWEVVELTLCEPKTPWKMTGRFVALSAVRVELSERSPLFHVPEPVPDTWSPKEDLEFEIPWAADELYTWQRKP